ncbi:MAG: HEPN domain-containing protein [Anaerolineales bacterium]|jgi:HEPN domain-containing protein
MNELTAEWVEKAEEDFASADVLLHAGEFPIPDTACFHCQQSAEKYLKAYLQEYQVKFERRHDLMPLLDLCVSVDKDFSILKNDLQVLDRYAVIARYPGIKLDLETAESALDAAERVQKFIRMKLGLK